MKKLYSKLWFWACISMLFFVNSGVSQCNQLTNIEAVVVQDDCIHGSVTYGVTYSSEVSYGMNSICYGYAITDQGNFVETMNFGPIDQQDHLNNPFTHYIEVTLSCNYGLTLFLHAWTNHDCGGNPCTYPFSQVLVLSPLPVNLVDFKVNKTLDGLLLTWQTMNEKNNRGFVVEHSTNGNQWKEIGFVNGRGNTDFLTDYSFLHGTPSLGTNYYRLAQFDFDGKIIFSPQVSMYNQGVGGLYPNLTSDFIHLFNTRESFYYLIDQLGNKLGTGLITGEPSTIDVSELHPGWYYIITEDNIAMRFLKY